MWITKSQMPLQHVLSSFVTEISPGPKFWFEIACVAVVYSWKVSISSEEKKIILIGKNKLSKIKKSVWILSVS